MFLLDASDASSDTCFEATFRNAAGQVIKFVSEPDPGDHQITTGYHGYIKDLTKEPEAAEKESRLATRDQMTGLLNYHEFCRCASASLSKLDPTDEKAIFIFADADNLKRTNDTFGHAAGDVLISAMAQIIEEKTPASCHVARKGGDEFVALAIVPTWANELELLKGLSDSLNCVYQFEGTEVSMSCCVGVSIGTNANTLVKSMELEADKALYQAKSQGSGHLKIFDEELGSEIRSIQILADDIGDALQNHQLSVLYQPIICLKSHEVVSVEALVRWNHPALGPIEPPKIVAAIQSEGLGSSFLEFLL